MAKSDAERPPEPPRQPSGSLRVYPRASSLSALGAALVPTFPAIFSSRASQLSRPAHHSASSHRRIAGMARTSARPRRELWYSGTGGQEASRRRSQSPWPTSCFNASDNDRGEIGSSVAFNSEKRRQLSVISRSSGTAQRPSDCGPNPSSARTTAIFSHERPMARPASVRIYSGLSG